MLPPLNAQASSPRQLLNDDELLNLSKSLLKKLGLHESILYPLYTLLEEGRLRGINVTQESHEHFQPFFITLKLAEMIGSDAFVALNDTLVKLNAMRALHLYVELSITQRDPAPEVASRSEERQPIKVDAELVGT